VPQLYAQQIVLPATVPLHAEHALLDTMLIPQLVHAVHAQPIVPPVQLMHQQPLLEDSVPHVTQIPLSKTVLAMLARPIVHHAHSYPPPPQQLSVYNVN